MPFPSVTYTFSNGTTADATQVSQNFTDLINGASDGTKNYSISALTAGGATILNAAVTLGASSVNNIVFNGSLASSIPIGTTNTYDIGSSTLGLRACYWGANSQTVKIVGSASMSATWAFTLPVSAGTNTYVLQTDGSGVSSWTSRTTLGLSTKTGASYSIASSDDTIIGDATSNGVTLTLPAPASNTGKVFKIKRLDATFAQANLVTIARNGSEKIDGVAANVVCATNGEAYELQTNGTDWFILRHDRDSAWISSTITITAVSVNPTTGTVAKNEALYRRVGDSMEISFSFKQTVGGTAGTGTYLFSIPGGFTIDTTKISASTTGDETYIGGASATSNGNCATCSMNIYDSTHLSMTEDNAAVTPVGSGAFNLSGASTKFNFRVSVPIVNWS